MDYKSITVTTEDAEIFDSIVNYLNQLHKEKPGSGVHVHISCIDPRGHFKSVIEQIEEEVLYIPLENTEKLRDILNETIYELNDFRKFNPDDNENIIPPDPFN